MVDNTASQVLIYPKAQDAAMLLSIAAESSPAAAANAFASGTGATVAAGGIKVNGLAAHRVLCDVATEQGVMRVLCYFIQKARTVYSFLGYTGPAQFDGHLGTFEQTVGRFRNLTDLARIDVKPERLTILATPRQASLRQALQNIGVPQNELEPHAILNGMGLDDAVPAGTLLKVVKQQAISPAVSIHSLRLFPARDGPAIRRPPRPGGSHAVRTSRSGTCVVSLARETGMSGQEGRIPVPLRRSSHKAIEQLDAVRADRFPAEALDAVPDLVAVLNPDREIVFANRAFRIFAGTGDLKEACGARHGELLGCVNAHSSPEGCGSAEACAGCGAAQAIDESLRTGQPAARDCSLTVWVRERRTARDLATHSVPFEIAESPYVMVVFRDMGQRVRRLALERIFFHDLLNTVSSLKLYVDLLKVAVSGDRENDLVRRMEAICASLVEEIRGQRTMAAAENGTLSVQHNLVDASELASELVRQFEAQEVTNGKMVSLAPFSESVTLVTDDSLARRILSNMLKNALEGSPEGSTVTLGVRAAGDRVEFWVHNQGAMPEDVQRRVFQRSFSTKGEGRGLGTWSMKILAEDYLGGSVRFSSTPADDTTFFLSLPFRPPRAPGPNAVQPSPPGIE